MRQTTMTLAIVVALMTVMPAPAEAQTSTPKKSRKALYATLGALGGAGLGALWIVKLCPTGSDSPSACIAPPVAFVVGGAWAGYRLGQRASHQAPAGVQPGSERSGVAARGRWALPPTARDWFRFDTGLARRADAGNPLRAARVPSDADDCS